MNALRLSFNFLSTGNASVHLLHKTIQTKTWNSIFNFPQTLITIYGQFLIDPQVILLRRNNDGKNGQFSRWSLLRWNIRLFGSNLGNQCHRIRIHFHSIEWHRSSWVINSCHCFAFVVESDGSKDMVHRSQILAFEQ